MNKIYELPVRIRFGQCDPAGIVFHPQYFTIFNAVMEDFFRDVVGTPFHQIIAEGTGLPVVGIHCDFVNPSRVGELCVAKVWVEKLGSASIRFAMTLECDGEPRLKMTETSVCVKRGEQLVAQPLPEIIRERLTPYLIEDETQKLKLRS